MRSQVHAGEFGVEGCRRSASLPFGMGGLGEHTCSSCSHFDGCLFAAILKPEPMPTRD